MAYLKPIPLSKAKTAYGLLQDVKRAILDEPKRVDMTVYTSYCAPEAGGPACGTVGCFAGWVALLSGAGMIQTERAAMTLLGVGLSYTLPKTGDAASRARRCGASTHFEVFNAGYGDSCEDTMMGTRAHARAVANRIDRFIKANEPTLRKRKMADARAELRATGWI